MALLFLFILLRSFFLIGKWAAVEDLEKGYSIQYPANWRVSIHESGHRNWPELYVEIDQRWMPINDEVWILGKPVNNPNFSDAFSWSDEFIQRQNGNYVSTATQTTIGVDNYPAIKRSYSRMGRYHHTIYFVLTEDQIISLKFTTKVGPIDEETENKFSHMLSSFKLLKNN